MSLKYTAAHEKPDSPDDARPTALQVIKDYALEGKLSGKVVLITGCSSGIGAETARALYRTGVTIYATARDVKKAKAVVRDLEDYSRVYILPLDLSSLGSVRSCTAQFRFKSTQLHILIENAGVMAGAEIRTADGFETQFSTNHLGHFLLFYLLKDLMLQSSTLASNSRAIIDPLSRYLYFCKNCMLTSCPQTFYD